MKLIRKNGHWIVALAGIASLAYSAGTMHVRLPALGTIEARETETAQAPREAEALSSGFRHAAKACLPAMVSIEVRGKAQMVNGGESGGLDGLENSPLGELFKSDPRMKEFFRMRPGQQQPMPRSHGMGLGFVIDSSGIILTANHAVVNAEA